MSQDVVMTVARTLRAAADWAGGSAAIEVQTLRDVADDVERKGVEWPCCPVCEEMTCDEDCPLAEARALRTGP